METFDLHIDLGNDAMRSPADVADALRKTATKIEIGHGEGSIFDVNGNTVGQYGFDSAAFLAQLDAERHDERGTVEL